MEKRIHTLKDLDKSYQELAELATLVATENDLELTAQVTSQAQQLLHDIEHFETITLLSGRYDNQNAILTIHAGTGGVDAQDWAQMLFRMYSRFIERQQWQVKLYDLSAAEEAGIKTATLHISGEFVYGMLKSETGVHRLVRNSPFNSKHSRETSFALVEVVPELDDTSAITIRPEDIRVDVFRAGGHGGQGVNTTDSAVRITHLASGIVVQCQNERSQLQNKDIAMKSLRNRLLTIQLAEKQQELQELKGSHKNSWGHQIRSYVMQPYTMVKDHRTNAEMTDVNKVLDGDIMQFIEAYLRTK